MEALPRDPLWSDCTGPNPDKKCRRLSGIREQASETVRKHAPGAGGLQRYWVRRRGDECLDDMEEAESIGGLCSKRQASTRAYQAWSGSRWHAQCSRTHTEWAHPRQRGGTGAGACAGEGAPQQPGMFWGIEPRDARKGRQKRLGPHSCPR